MASSLALLAILALVGSVSAKGAQPLALTPQASMTSLSVATNELSPIFTKAYFNKQSPAFNFIYNNLKARTFTQFTLFYPTDAAYARYMKTSKARPVNCPPVPMRNIIAQQLVPGRYNAKQLRSLGAVQSVGRSSGKRKNLLPTLSPMAVSVLNIKPQLEVGLINNGYYRVISQAKVVVPDAVVTRTYVVHLVDNVLTACI